MRNSHVILVEEGIVRKVPTQERSQRRVEAILQATIKLVLTHGYDATTTAMIAEAANVPIGSLYQFFANKEAILAALAQRYVDHLLALRILLFSGDIAAIPLPTLVDRTADTLIAFVDEHRGYTQLFNHAVFAPEIATTFAHMQQEMVEGITAVIMGKAPQMPQAAALACAKTLLHLIQGILPLVESSTGAERQIATRELKRAWLAYLTAVIAEETSQLS
jgi:AcrR family transcriptional regulator